MRISTFQHVYDNVPRGVEVSWEALVQALTTFRPRAEKLETPCWSPASYSRPRRVGSNVEDVCALVLDYDDGRTITEADRAWSAYERVMHTSWSHRPEAHRFRLVMPLERPVPGPLWRQLYVFLLEADGGAADPKCCDPNRLFLVPVGPGIAWHKRGARPDLLPLAQRLDEQRRRREERQRRRAKKEAARIRRMVYDAESKEGAVRRLLTVDPDARRQYGEGLGGRLRHRGEIEVVTDLRCPACGQHDVWYIANRAGDAACNHVNSCGWSGPLWSL
jgi:hypothetical protein